MIVKTRMSLDNDNLGGLLSSVLVPSFDAML